MQNMTTECYNIINYNNRNNIHSLNQTQSEKREALLTCVDNNHVVSEAFTSLSIMKPFLFSGRNKFAVSLKTIRLCLKEQKL